VTFAADSWRALGTYVQLVVADAQRIGAARALAHDLLAAVDHAYSRFRDDSDLVRVNRAAGAWVPVSSLLIEALAAAVTAAEDSDGLVDPTLGHSLAALGYDDDLDAVRRRASGADAVRRRATGADAVRRRATGPADLPAAVPARRGAWSEIETDAAAGAVRIPVDVALDLGATGKAFAADLIAGRIARDVGAACILSLGGDVAIGDTGSGVDHGWQVAVSESPDDAPDETLTLGAGGLATSSTTVRTWTRGNRTVHHLLDPATGLPVRRCWRTVSVIAETCLEANTASTAAVVLGESAPQWLHDRGLAARLVDTAGTVRRTGSWPAQVFDMTPGPAPEGGRA
jgi:thiamine biosynthesis lipoprotein